MLQHGRVSGTTEPGRDHHSSWSYRIFILLASSAGWLKLPAEFNRPDNTALTQSSDRELRSPPTLPAPTAETESADLHNAAAKELLPTPIAQHNLTSTKRRQGSIDKNDNGFFSSRNGAYQSDRTTVIPAPFHVIRGTTATALPPRFNDTASTPFRAVPRALHRQTARPPGRQLAWDMARRD